MTKRYSVKKEHFEFRPTRYSSVEEAWNERCDHDIEEVGIYDTLEEARAMLDTVSVYSHRYGSQDLAGAVVAYIDEESGEWEDEEWECYEVVYASDLKHEQLDPTLVVKTYQSNAEIYDERYEGASMSIRYDADYIACYFDKEMYNDEDEAIDDYREDLTQDITERFPRATNIEDVVNTIMITVSNTISNAWRYSE